MKQGCKSIVMNALELKTSELSSKTNEIDNKLPLNYTFNHRGLPFDCYIDHDETDDRIIVKLTADLGHLPYSAENKAKRAEMLLKLGPLMAKGKISLDSHCKLSVIESTSMGDELCAKKLMECLLYTLLDIRDIIDVVVPANKP